MAAIVVPFRRTGKLRLALPPDVRARIVEAMLADVFAAAAAVGDVILADREGGQGTSVAAALRRLEGGPVLVVNADLPCATADDLRELLAAAPALVAARDGTTNALALHDPAAFLPLYGPGSARRFTAELGAAPLALPNLADDVDTLEDLARVAGRLGACSRAAVATLGLAA